MLAAMNTGHEGGCATVHANSAQAVPDRIVALALAAGMAAAGAHAQLAAGLDVVVHLARRPRCGRVVAEVGIVRTGAGAARVEAALRREGEVLQPGPGHALLCARLGLDP
jgi:pilus assembly protein CpaF